MRNKTYHRRKMLVVFLAALAVILGLFARLVYLMVFEAEYYQKKAEDLHERERDIKAARGEILDANGTVLTSNRTVCTVSVIHSQIQDPDGVIRGLAGLLDMEESEIRKKVEKVSSIERIRTNVDKETGDQIRALGLAGVKVDEDYKRYYPYDELASKVLGFTGGDNQGIIGLEVIYEEYLKGIDGKILTTTDAQGDRTERRGGRQDRTGGRTYSADQSGLQHSDLCTADGGKSDGGKTGGKGGDPDDESEERRNPCHGQCAGIQSERSIYLKYAGRGRRFVGRGKAGGSESDVEKRVHQRYL